MNDTEERHGEAFEFAEQLTVVGRKLGQGDTAPAFCIERFDAAEGAIRTVLLSNTAGTVRLLNVVNSLDTPVCQVETRRWEKMREALPEAVTVYTISMDLPFAQLIRPQRSGPPFSMAFEPGGRIDVEEATQA